MSATVRAVGGLLSWLADPDGTRGIHFSEPGGGWSFTSYVELAHEARRAERGLAAYGVGTGDVVTTVLPSSGGFVASFFGALLRGAVPSPVAPFAAYQDPTAYRRHLEGVLACSRPRVVVADEETAGGLETVMEDLAAGDLSLRLVTYSELLRAGGAPERETPQAPPDTTDPERAVLLQFTSGSSGLAKGVSVPARALESNIAAIGEWLGFAPSRPVASWLPIHHDMGLIGCLLAPVCLGSDVWLMRPEEFVFQPDRYLQCFSEHGAALSAMPSFGLAHIVRRARLGPDCELDLSGVHGIVLGAERTDPALVVRAEDALAAAGLPRGSLVPAYGLAESSLAVTGVPPGTELRVALHSGTGGRIETLRPLRDGAPTGLLTCGRMLRGLAVTVVDDDGRPAPPGTVGEILVEGSSVASGYRGDSNPLSYTRFCDGMLHTGDAGAVLDGELFVVGRLGDSVKIRGLPVFAEDLELELARTGLRPHKLVVALGLAERPTVLVLLEDAAEDALLGARDLCRRRVPGAEVVAQSVSKGSLERTSSGKPRRRILWERYRREGGSHG